MSSFLLNALTQPLGQQIFCEFFNDDEVPLPPSGQPYYVETQNNAVQYVSSSGEYYIES